MRIILKNTASIAALSVAGIAAASPALAQVEADDANDDNIIVVTAQKQEQTLIEVPINVSVVGQDEIDNFGLNEIEKLSDFVPGLQVQSQSVNIPSYTLRGVVADGGAARVALFQNGVSISDPRNGSNLALFDMERIEVVKGPQATLFGQGALIGGINFIQNRASTDGISGSAGFEYGNFNSLRADGHLNLPIGDSLAVRVAGIYRERDGHVEQLGTGPDTGGYEQYAIRGAVHFAPADWIKADVIVNYQDDATSGTPFQSGAIPVNGTNVDLFGPVAHNLNADQAAARDSLGVDRTVFSVTGNVEIQLGDMFTFTSVTDYRDVDALQVLDADASRFNILGFITNETAKAFSQELRLNFDDGGPFTAFFGANYFEVDAINNAAFTTDNAHFQALFADEIAAALGTNVAGVEAGLGFFMIPGAANFDNITDPLRFSAIGRLNPAVGATLPLNADHLESLDTVTERKSYDLFADFSYEVTDQLELTGGIRLTAEELSLSGAGRLDRGNVFLGGGSNALNFGTTFLYPNNAFAGQTSSDLAATWRLNAAYRVSDDVNIWIAHGRGRRPEVLVQSGTGANIIEAEILDNYEIGMFGRFLDGRAQISTSIYYSQYQNFQTEFVDPVTMLPVTANAGNATQYGFEFDSRFAVTDNVNLIATYAYNNSTFDDTDGDGNELRFAGNTFRLSPKHSFTLAADISFPVGDAGSVSFFPSYSWRSRQFFEDDNSLDITANGMGGFNRVPEIFFDGSLVNEFQDSYGELDLKVEFQSADERWSIYAFAENITDEDFLIDGGNTGGNIGDIHSFIRGLPRTFGAGVGFKF